jgi:GTPase
MAAYVAHLQVVGQTYQQLETPSPRTYIGSGKVEEVVGAVAETAAETLIFDDELSPGQLRNLERALGDRVRICDRTALILDIFSQRAATREGQLQAGFPAVSSCFSAVLPRLALLTRGPVSVVLTLV